jgi:hypothetical protein
MQVRARAVGDDEGRAKRSLLAPLLQSGWQWPRTDMQHWIHPLNRFDEILETRSAAAG